MYARAEAKLRRSAKEIIEPDKAMRNFRATWLLFSFLICLTVVSQRLDNYFRVPTTTDSKVVQEDVVRFPPVVLCPYGFDDAIFDSLVKSEVKKLCDLNPDCRKLSDKDFENYHLSNLNFTIEMIWKKFGIVEDFVGLEIYMPFLKHKKPVENVTAHLRTFESIMGNCVEVYLDEEFYFKGYYTYLTINVEQHLHTVVPNLLPNETNDVWLYIPNNKLYTDHGLYYSVRPIPKRCKMEFQLSTQEFNILNLNSRPCSEEKEAVYCEINCLKNRLSESINCSLPFHNVSNRDTCSTVSEILTSYRTAIGIYDSMSEDKCNCLKICKHTVHTTIATMEQFTTDNTYATSFSLRFANGFRAITTEDYLYPLSALISDIGGNIGFFLGLSVLTVLEYVTNAISVYVKKRKVVVNVNNRLSAKPVEHFHKITRFASVTKN